MMHKQANNRYIDDPMLQLKSLSDQAEALKIVLRQAVRDRKPESEIQEITEQLKSVVKLIYERKVMLKREGLYKTGSI